ncbi:hypothetical protein IEQ34_018616 [Dendrobium chrysotoxum]|uniref:Uncharacterized protein n=1 Tax=Dendrobium chrysotoxum TaxID=161865 RepID=A0AAV7G537_DENCH|nr:hypothetical protein IEQ34_018616 [Dendrobium chrysotoxum]
MVPSSRAIVIPGLLSQRRCGYPAINASYYDLSYHPTSTSKDCKLYKNARNVKCYDCDSCKQGWCRAAHENRMESGCNLQCDFVCHFGKSTYFLIENLFQIYLS